MVESATLFTTNSRIGFSGPADKSVADKPSPDIVNEIVATCTGPVMSPWKEGVVEGNSVPKSLGGGAAPTGGLVVTLMLGGFEVVIDGK